MVKTPHFQGRAHGSGRQGAWVQKAGHMGPEGRAHGFRRQGAWVQWLRLHISKAGHMGSESGWGNATQCGNRRKKRNWS